MAKVSNPILFILLTTTLLLLGINLSLQNDSARANEPDSTRANEADSARTSGCLAAPKASAPKGQHWYYWVERQKGRKCWYLHATAPLAHHAAARSRSDAAARPRSDAAKSAVTSTHRKPAAHEAARPAPPPTNTQPALEAASAAATVATAAAEATPPATDAAPVADAPPPAGLADGAQPQPHIEILRTVPVGVPTQQAAQPSASATPATQVAPAAQIGSTTAVSNGTSKGSADAIPSNAGSDAKNAMAVTNGTSTGADAVPSNTGSDAKTAMVVTNAPSTGSADAVPSNTGSDAENAASAVHDAEPNAESSGSDAAQQKPAEAPGLADTIATLQPTEMFFLVAIGLSMALFLIAIASRIAAKRREPIITDYPDSAWSNHRSDLPRVDNTQFTDQAMDEQWINEEQDVPFIDPQGVNDLHEQDWLEQPLPARSDRKKSTSSAAPSGPDPKGFGPVLRILRQA